MCKCVYVQMCKLKKQVKTGIFSNRKTINIIISNGSYNMRKLPDIKKFAHLHTCTLTECFKLLLCDLKYGTMAQARWHFDLIGYIGPVFQIG